MSNDTQKTYSAQTASFLAKVGECMPRLDSEDMQAWIQNPKLLKRMLEHALSNPCDDLNFPQVAVKKRKISTQYWGDLKEVKSSVEDISCKGSNPFELHNLSVDLKFFIEYQAYDDHIEIVFRPLLNVFNDDLMDDVEFYADHFFRGHKKMGLALSGDDLLSMLCRQTYSLSQMLHDAELEYANALAAHLNTHCTTRFSVEEMSNEWVVNLFLLKDGASAFSTQFHFPKNAISQGIEKKAQRERELDAAH